jgi:hypothetical protein
MIPQDDVHKRMLKLNETAWRRRSSVLRLTFSRAECFATCCETRHSVSSRYHVLQYDDRFLTNDTAMNESETLLTQL